MARNNNRPRSVQGPLRAFQSLDFSSLDIHLHQSHRTNSKALRQIVDRGGEHGDGRVARLADDRVSLMSHTIVGNGDKAGLSRKGYTHRIDIPQLVTSDVFDEVRERDRMCFDCHNPSTPTDQIREGRDLGSDTSSNVDDDVVFL
jgi:hypothetical protein